MPNIYLFLFWTSITAVSVMISVLLSNGLFIFTAGKAHANHLSKQEKVQMLNDSSLFFLILYVFIAFFCFALNLPSPIFSAIVITGVAKIAYTHYALNLYRIKISKPSKKVVAGMIDVMCFVLLFGYLQAKIPM